MSFHYLNFFLHNNKSTEKFQNELEPLVQEQREKRYCLFPIKPEEVHLYKRYKESVSCIWTLEEVNFSNDRADFQKLPKNVQQFLKVQLSFFASADVLIIENLISNFCGEITDPIVLLYYSQQGFIEGVHSEVYATLIDTLVEDQKEKTQLFYSLENDAVIAKKANFAIQYMSQENSIALRLLIFGLFEGVCFVSGFASIYYIRQQYPGMLEGVVFSNSLISRDEGQHASFAALLYKTRIKYKLSQEKVNEICRELLEIEKEFSKHAVPCQLIGLNADDLIEHIKFTIDNLIVEFGYDKVFNTEKTPLQFLDQINLSCKTNFFETKVDSYSKFSNSEMNIQDIESLHMADF